MNELLYQNVIDVPKWDKAKWRAVAFIMDMSGEKIPVLALAFENGSSGKEIFKQWHKQFGDVDEFEELRVSIIEGDIPGENPGYSIVISSNPDHTIKRAQAQGQTVDADKFLIGSRIHRMNPPAGSNNLSMFKKAYAEKKTYLLIPASLSKRGLQPYFELGIVKSEIHFRHIDEVKPDDIESLVLVSSKRDD